MRLEAFLALEKGVFRRGPDLEDATLLGCTKVRHVLKLPIAWSLDLECWPCAEYTEQPRGHRNSENETRFNRYCDE